MFKRGCEKCGEFWYIGNDSTCSCPDEALAQTAKDEPKDNNAFKSKLEEERAKERQRIVNLFMIQHEMAKGAHNYWHVAAQLIQADVASDT